MALFFADECVAALVVEQLRDHGHDVAEAAKVCPGYSDDQVLKLAAAAGRVLITDDQGFGELAVRYGQAALGVIILSLYGLPAGVRETYAADQIATLANRIDGHLAIVEPGRVRLRPLPGRENN